jgi:hypothetical protein
MDERRLALLRELERALLEALSESADVHRSLERMHGEGYTLQLYLDCQRDEDGETGVRSPVRVVAERRSGVDRRAAANGGRRTPGDAGEPIFRINSDDLRMLRALGIDPTRKGRARR